MVAIRRNRAKIKPMTTPNFADRTIWTGDNVDILRGLNSAPKVDRGKRVC